MDVVVDVLFLSITIKKKDFRFTVNFFSYFPPTTNSVIDNKHKKKILNKKRNCLIPIYK